MATASAVAVVKTVAFHRNHNRGLAPTPALDCCIVITLPRSMHNLSRQAIGLLDDLDKELNTYAMRLKEWYGWHFPELGKIVPDNMMYAKAVQMMGIRTNCKSIDFSEVLAEEVTRSLGRGGGA